MKYVLILFVLACMIGSLASPLFAAQDGDVIVANEVVLRVRYPAGGLSVKERADIITSRLINYLGTHAFSPNDVRVAVINKEYTVMIGNNLIITADKRTAEFNRTTRQQLANIWAGNLRYIIPKAKAL